MRDGPESARVANRNDAARVSELARELIAVLLDSRGGAPVAATIAALGGADDLATRLAGEDGGGIVVGTYDGVVVGFAVVELPQGLSPSGAASIVALYVEPEVRRVGVGEAVLNEVARLALAHGATSLDVPALPGDAQTKSFLEAMGLRARLLVMNRALSP